MVEEKKIIITDGQDLAEKAEEYKKSFYEYCRVRMKKNSLLGILLKNKYNMQHCKSTIYE